MTFGVNWTFESATSDGGPPRMGDYLAGYAPAASWPLARAVAAASCFPPVFNPLPLHLDPAALTRGDYRGPERDQLVAGIRLSDGGLYDNLGLEPVWKRHATVLVSDGGGVFEQAPDRGLVWRVQRYTRIIERQSRALRTRWLMAGASDPAQNLAIAYWGIGRAPEAASPGAPTYA
jgi:NTE family protein